MNGQIAMTPIGTIRSCYGAKFGIPRQPGLVPDATATLELFPPFNSSEALRGLDGFSHVWILFLFHESVREEWKATVRPPRLGGNERIGVFASRSNFRPNPIGLSVVPLIGIEGTTLKLGGGDFLDGTPVLDIKPYIPYADSIASATGSYAAMAPQPENQVAFSPKAEQAIQMLENTERPALRKIIVDMLSFNPRPAYLEDEPGRLYGTRLFDLEVRWTQSGNRATVTDVEMA